MNNSSYQGKLKETTQLGVELVNEDSSSADAEMIALTIDCFQAAGLKEFQIEIGQVDFFKGLMEEAGLDGEQEEQIRALIQNKNFFGLQDLADGLHLTESAKQVLFQFDDLYGGIDMIKKARELTTNKCSLRALERLEKLHHVLENYGLERFVSYDLGMLDLYDYYTGVIFKGYTYGTGDALVKGGRYNNLLKQFGKHAPSIGFAFRVDELMLALSRQNIEVALTADTTMVLYKVPQQKIAIDLAKHFRSQGLKVELMRYSSKKSLNDYKAYAKDREIGGILCFENASDVHIITIATGEENRLNLKEFMKGLE